MSVLQRFRKGPQDLRWAYKFTFGDEQVLRQTPFTNKAQAEKAERDHRFLLESGHFTEADKIRKRKAAADTTLAQIEECYKLAPVDAADKTRKNNISSFKLIVRKAYASTSDISALPASIINADLAKKWFDAAARDAQTETQLEQGKTRRTANSTMQQAKSLFTDRALDHYRTEGLILPHVAEFLSTVKTRKFSKAIKRDYYPPTDAIISKTLRAWMETENRNLFLIIGLSLSFGLRKSEIGQATWEWLTTRENIPCLDATGMFKGGTGLLQVRALDPFFTTFRNVVRAKEWQGKAKDYILIGSPTHRTNTAFRDVSEWMRTVGWETQKTVHEFRAYSGSQVAMRYGIYDAMSWLRHSSVKVTEGHYARYVKQFRAADPATLPTKWAEAAPAQFVPQIIPAAAAC